VVSFVHWEESDDEPLKVGDLILVVLSAPFCSLRALNRAWSRKSSTFGSAPNASAM
jgi:hypothetical protein